MEFPEPRLQAGFALRLKHFRSVYLQDALFEAVRTLDIEQLDRELARFVRKQALSGLARSGLRGEVAFAVPLVLRSNPYLLGYYRLLLGYSQKEFYGGDKGFSAAKFKKMESDGIITDRAEPQLGDLCAALCGAASFLLEKIGPARPNLEFLDDLTLLTVGPQFRGGANNLIGTEGIAVVFEVIRQIVSHAASEISGDTIRIRNATGRMVLIKFSSDPDIVISEEIGEGEIRNVVAIEVKSGSDISNIHNRIGEAEKSHQKARKRGFTECWTVVNIPQRRLDMEKLENESPSTDRFYSLDDLSTGRGETYAAFCRRVLALTSIKPRGASVRKG